MRLLTLFVVSLSILGCVAQRSNIALPLPGTNITPSQDLVVQVERPDSLQGSTEVGIVIGLLQCQQDPCPDPRSQVGAILFNGQYKPEIHERPGEPYQNFSVAVPPFQPSSGMAKAQLTTARFHLIGAGPSPDLEVNRLSLNIIFT